MQVTLSIELNDSQLDEFERMIPVQLAQPPWNYTLPLSKGIMVSLTANALLKIRTVITLVSFVHVVLSDTDTITQYSSRPTILGISSLQGVDKRLMSVLIF